MIGPVDVFAVMLHHEHRIAQIAHPAQGIQEAAVVAWMKPDARFVKDIEHAGQPRTDLSRQADALAFTARKGGGGPIQGEVIEAHLG